MIKFDEGNNYFPVKLKKGDEVKVIKDIYVDGINLKNKWGLVASTTHFSDTEEYCRKPITKEGLMVVGQKLKVFFKQVVGLVDLTDADVMLPHSEFEKRFKLQKIRESIRAKVNS